jgi:hypothetical protein
MASLALFGTCPLPSMAQSICWHGNLACYAVESDVYLVDVGSSATVATLRGASHGDRIDILLAASSHALLVCLTRMENVLVFNLHTLSLVCSLGGKADGKPDGDGNGFVAACVSAVHPFVFYSRHGSKLIYMLDLTNQRVTGKFDGKKTVTCLAAHPTKPLFASGHIDGSIRLWDYQLGSCRVSEEYNSLASSSAKLAPSPFGITALTIGADVILAASPIGLVVAFKASNRGFSVIAARVLNASRGTANLGVLTSIEFHGKQDFFLSCFAMGKIQSWRVVTSDGTAAIVRSADVTPADFMHLLRGAYRSTMPPFVDLPVLRDFLVRKIVLHPTKCLLAFTLEEYKSDTATEKQISGAVASERLHPIFDMTSAYNPNVPRVPAAACVATPFVGGFSSATDAQRDLFYVKRGQLIAFSVQANENVVIRPIPEMSSTVHPTRVYVSPGGAVMVQVEKVEAPGNANNSGAGVASLTLSGRQKLESEKLVSKRLATVTSAYVLPKNGSSWDGFEARDAVFFGKDHYAILDRAGLSLSLVHQGNANRVSYSGWDTPLERLFVGPEAELFVYFSWNLSLLCFSFSGKAASPYWPNVDAGSFATRKKETVLQLEWQTFGSVRRPACFVVTNERLIILDDKLHLLAQCECVPVRGLWCGSAVVFSCRESCTVDYLCLDGFVGTLCSTDSESDTSLCVVVRDRLIFVANSLSDAQIKAAIVWPFECIAHGILSLGLSDSATEELLKGAMGVLDFGTAVSRDLLLRLLSARAFSVCRQILASAPALCARLIEDGLWTEAAPAAAAVPVGLVVARPDHPDSLMVQRLDFYRGTAFKPLVEERAHASAPSNAVPHRKFLPVPVGFFPLELRSARLPSVGTSTPSSSVLSMEMTPVRPDLLPVKTSAGTPVLPMRKPPPASALPKIPSVATTATPPSVALTQLMPMAVQVQNDDDDEEEEADLSASSSVGSPLRTRRVSAGEPADHFSQIPLELRTLTDSIVIPTDPVENTSAHESQSFVSLIQIGSNSTTLLERGDAIFEECLSLLDLKLLVEAL